MMMDNEPRMQDRSPEGQMFSIESEIKNMMKEYEMAVRDGDNQRAQMIADQIDRMQQKIIDLQGGIANKMLSNQLNSRGSSNLDRQILSQQMTGKDFFAKGDEVKKSGPLGLGIIEAIRGGVGSAFTDPMSAQNYAMNAIKGRMKQDEPTIREMFEKAFKQARMEGKEVFEFMGKMYHTKTAEEVQGMAEGGEAQMPDMSEQEAMAELESIAPQAQMIEQLIVAVVKMIQQGVSEAEVREFLKEQGLDDEDIEDLFMMVMQQIEQAPAEEPIGQELQGMM